jgi:drug/metabolite transporter superfamily protein YnfA
LRSLAVSRSGRGCVRAGRRIAALGVVSLSAFAAMLTRVDAAFAGRAYATYTRHLLFAFHTSVVYQMKA